MIFVLVTLCYLAGVVIGHLSHGQGQALGVAVADAGVRFLIGGLPVLLIHALVARRNKGKR